MTKKKNPEDKLKTGPKDPVWNEDKALKLFQDMIDWQLAKPENVYWEKFLVFERGLYPDVISHLIGRFPKCSALKKKAEKVQEIKLMEQRGHDTIKSIFLLKNKHGYTDKTEVKTENQTTMRVERDELRALTPEELRERVRLLTEGGKN